MACQPSSPCQGRKRSAVTGAALILSVLTVLQTPAADAFMTPSSSTCTHTAPLHASLHDGLPLPSSLKGPTRKKMMAKRNIKSTSSKLVLSVPRSRIRNSINSSEDEALSRLSHEEEMSLLEEMRSYPIDSSTSQIARQTLLLHNLPLVKSIVTKILRSRPHLRKMMENPSGKISKGPLNAETLLCASSATESRVGAALTRDDLLHEGTIGLAEAIDRYDFSYSHVKSDNDVNDNLPKGARLGTYATYWIRARILRAIQNREYAFRFPERTLLASHRLVKAAKELGLDWAAVEDLKEDDLSLSRKELLQRKEVRTTLLKAAGITSESLFREAVRVRAVCKSGNPTPLESWMSPSPSSADQEEDELMSEAAPQHIRETLSKFLMPKEVEVLSLRYGLVTPSDETDGFGDGVLSGVGETHQRVFRDYEAEAEEELFGSNGILSHYTTEPSQITYENISYAKSPSSKKILSPTASAAKANPPRVTSPRTKTMASFSSSSLLSYKEVGKQMTLSAEYCRRLCTAALQKLARAAEEGRLAESDFLLGW